MIARLGPGLRWCISLAILAGLALWLEPARVIDQVRDIQLGWLALALLLGIIQMALSAWRWRFTAGRLGLKLEPGQALTDYYLAAFVNQVLPGGVLGDAWRAQRHAQRSGQRGAAWRAVILERTSGQLIVLGLALLTLMFQAPWREHLLNISDIVGIGLMGFGLLILLTGLILRRSPVGRAQLAELAADARRALLALNAWPLQLLSSVLIVLSYLLVFAAGARGIGIDLALGQLMLLALPVLLAMLIPVTVAGWGLREGAAGAIWLLAGLPPEQGVAASLAYGLLVLIASLPGAVVLAIGPRLQTDVH